MRQRGDRTHDRLLLMEHREQWRHPQTQEVAEVELLAGVARLVRNGTLEERRHSPTWEQDARDQIAQQQETMQDFARMRKEFGLPLDLSLKAHLSEVPSTFSFKTSISLDEQPVKQLQQTLEQPLESVFITADIGDIHVRPPDDRVLLTEFITGLRKEGFVRHTTRLPDGSLWLPEEAEPWRGQLEGTEQSVVRLTGDPDRVPPRWGSKLGGVPYRPLGTPWPVAKKGDYPLSFLAQLNLAELNPDGLHLPDFPATGLLQFFVMDDMFYGAEDEPWMALNGAQTFSRVLYWPSVIQDEDLLEPGAVTPPGEAPWEGEPSVGEELPYDPEREIALVGMPDREPVTGSDRVGAPWMGLNPDEVPLADGATTLLDALYTLSVDGHKLGGYPDFTQSDPRGQDDDDLVQLFQLDTDREMGVMWGSSISSFGAAI